MILEQNDVPRSNPLGGVPACRAPRRPACVGSTWGLLPALPVPCGTFRTQALWLGQAFAESQRPWMPVHVLHVRCAGCSLAGSPRTRAPRRHACVGRAWGCQRTGLRDG
jgi:hypothetical protein